MDSQPAVPEESKRLLRILKRQTQTDKVRTGIQYFFVIVKCVSSFNEKGTLDYLRGIVQNMLSIKSTKRQAAKSPSSTQAEVC